MAEFIRFEASEAEESASAVSVVESEEEIQPKRKVASRQKKKPGKPLTNQEKSPQQDSESDSDYESDRSEDGRIARAR